MIFIVPALSKKAHWLLVSRADKKAAAACRLGALCFSCGDDLLAPQLDEATGAGGIAWWPGDDSERRLVVVDNEDAVIDDDAGTGGGGGGGGESGVNGARSHFVTRRALVLRFKGDVIAAKRAWESGMAVGHAPPNFSCTRGHLLHASCFQGLLFAGRGCPSCQEPFWLPAVTPTIVDASTLCPADPEAEAKQAQA